MKARLTDGLGVRLQSRWWGEWGKEGLILLLRERTFGTVLNGHDKRA